MTSDSETEKLRFEKAMQELARSGIWKSNHNPPVLRLWRAVGLASRPPHYADFGTNLLVCALYFGPMWGLFMWFFVWKDKGMPIDGAVMGSILAGGLFGMGMAYYYKVSARRAKLSKWEDLA
ncbi:MAG: DUF6404 family protein [Albidovulum sp.]